MTDSIENQCKRLYIEAFQDDEQFTDLLFERFFNSSCRYICENDIIISMLFAIDITLDELKGKYVYAVATDKKYRGKGYMSRLFESICNEYKGEYDFLCLKPMSKSLFNYYEKLGFERNFKKSEVIINNEKEVCGLVSLSDINDVKRIRKSLLKENYAEYCDGFYDLLFSYCDMFSDDIRNPKVFAVKEKLSGRVKEVIGEYFILSDGFIGKPLLTPGDGFDFAMVKYLNNKRFKDKYLGFALD